MFSLFRKSRASHAQDHAEDGGHTHAGGGCCSDGHGHHGDAHEERRGEPDGAPAMNEEPSAGGGAPATADKPHTHA